MLPLGLFRSRAFTGVQLAAFAVSGSMFALFLYLTLYLQNFLGYSPIEAGHPLPADHGRAPSSSRRSPGVALAKVQARYLMAAGLALTGVGLLLMRRAQRRARNGRRCCSASSSPASGSGCSTR